MAEDSLLLEHFPLPGQLRFRHYGWTEPAFTFGYSQKYTAVKNHLCLPSVQLCRRPSGGGLVDHRNDWTYSFVISPQHLLFKEKGTTIYRLVHQSLALALKRCGQPAELLPCSSPSDQTEMNKRIIKGEPDLCFENPAPYDIILPSSREKLAGAALKRSRRGLLLQGSIDRTSASAVHDWTLFRQSVLEALATLFQAIVEPVPQPVYPPEIETSVKDLFYSQTWNERR